MILDIIFIGSNGLIESWFYMNKVFSHKKLFIKKRPDEMLNMEKVYKYFCENTSDSKYSCFVKCRDSDV